MPESYELALFLHLVGVFIFAGAATTEVVVLAMMRRAKDVAMVRMWAGLGNTVEKAFPVAVLLLLGSGAWLVEREDQLGWGWGDGWINVSLITLVAMAIAGPLVIGRKIGAIERSARESPDGEIPQLLGAQVNDPVLFGSAHAMTLAAIAIIWNMTTKPGDAQAGTVILIALVVGGLSAVPMVQRQQAILEGRK